MAFSLDSDGVSFGDHTGKATRILWVDLQEVYIQTTDEGPFVEDVFFVLVTEQGRLRIPQGMPDSDALLKRLQELPGFDNETLIRAMTCVGNERFLCWRRQAG